MKTQPAPKNASPDLLAIVLLCALTTSCQTTHSEPEAKPATGRIESGKVQNVPAAKEVNRYEFVESELVPHPEDEKEFNHLYMGSRDGYDFISARARRYMIPSMELELARKFPYTQDSTKWIPMRVNFSQIEYQ